MSHPSIQNVLTFLVFNIILIKIIIMIADTARMKRFPVDKSGVLFRLVYIFKWTIWFAFVMALCVLHDFIWYAAFNPLFNESQVDIHPTDSFIKSAILLVVYSYILPCKPSMCNIVVYSLMLSWLALAQNLPLLIGKMSSVLGGVLLVDLKYSLTFIQKFIIFRLMDLLQVKILD